MESTLSLSSWLPSSFQASAAPPALEGEGGKANNGGDDRSEAGSISPEALKVYTSGGTSAVVQNLPTDNTNGMNSFNSVRIFWQRADGGTRVQENRPDQSAVCYR